MENASKALLIAAGIFFGILVLSIFTYIYAQISNYYNEKNQLELQSQIAQFNSQYERYTLDDIRGNDLLSLISKVTDYNARKSQSDGIGYERIKLKITIKSSELKDFKYNGKTGNLSYNSMLSQNINNLSGNDSNLYIVINRKNETLEKLDRITLEPGDITEKHLQKLSTNISNIFAPYEYSDKTSQEYIRASNKRFEIINELFGIDLKDFNNPASSNYLSSKAKLETIEQATLQYYEYQQFKRAHFKYKATSQDYNKDTGRIVKMEFEFNGKFE